MNARTTFRSVSPGLRPRPLAVAAAGLFLTVAPSASLAQPAGPQQAVERVEQEHGCDAARSVERLARGLRQEGIPADALWDRALEGIAKDVSEEPYLAGLRSYGERLIRAGAVLPEAATASAVVAAADAIQRGVPAAAIRQVTSPTSGREADGPALPLVVLGDLVSAGVPVDQALSVVRSALERGLGPREMLVTSWSVRGLIGQGWSPRAAARAVGRALGQGRTATSVPAVGFAPSELPTVGAPVPPGAGPPGTEATVGGSGD